MKIAMLFNLILAFSAFGLHTVATAQAADPGTVKGTMTVGQEKIDLKFVYSHQYKNEEGMDDGPRLRVLLTDREVPASIIFGYKAPFSLASLVKKGKVRGVLLEFNPKKLKEGLKGDLLYPSDNPLATVTTINLSGEGYVRELRVRDRKVFGEIYWEPFGDPATGLSAVFNAPLLTEGPAVKLSGSRALKSAPARAFLSYMKALHNGDFEAARLSATAELWDQMESSMSQAGGEAEFKKMIIQFSPDPARAAKQIKSVFIWGTRAVIMIDDKGTKAVKSMQQIDGTWKVD